MPFIGTVHPVYILPKNVRPCSQHTFTPKQLVYLSEYGKS